MNLIFNKHNFLIKNPNLIDKMKDITCPQKMRNLTNPRSDLIPNIGQDIWDNIQKKVYTEDLWRK